MVNKTYQLETLTCPTCASKIESILKKTKGVLEAEVMFMSSKAKVTFDENMVNSQMIKDRIGKLGYQVLSEK